MSWRVVVVKSNAKVDYKMDYLVVRSLEATRRIHISEISVLILESTAVSVTAYALNELLKQKVDVIFCDEHRNPCGHLLPLNAGYDTSGRIRAQMKWTDAAKQNVWTEIVREKIRGQRDILVKYNRSQSELLTQYIREIELNDATNREGHAAKVYFNALFGSEFSRSAECVLNAALNYGYSLILSAVNREIAVAGYLTQIGIFHDNVFNAFNLGCDFMEPLRPMIDNAVLMLKPEKLEHEEKMALVSILNSEVEFEGRTQYLSYALKLYCKSLFTALQSGNTEDIHFIRYEL